MVKIECPGCFRDNYTASPTVKSKCAYCGCFFAVEEMENNLSADPSTLKRIKGLGKIRLNNNL